MFWVYILHCNDNSYYTGHTDNLDNRLAQHQHKMIPTCYTSSRLPVQLVYSQSFPTREEALSAEKQIQGWNRKKKAALIQHDWKSVSYYAKRATSQTSTADKQG